MRGLLYCLAGTAFFLSLMGCEDTFVNEVEVDLPDNERQLVIEATLRPGDTSFAYVTRTRDVNDDRGVVGVADAEIVASVEGREVARFVERTVLAGAGFSFGDEAEFLEYYAVVPAEHFVAGAAFTLEVEVPGGVRATASQPCPGRATMSGLRLRAADFDTRLTVTLEGAVTRGGYLLSGEAYQYLTAFDSLGEPSGAFDTIADPLRFSTGEDFDYVEYGERFPVISVGGGTTAVVADVRGGFSGCASDDCDDFPRAAGQIRVIGINRLAADYYEALQQLEQTDGNPFVEPVALPNAFAGGRGMLVVESRPTVVVAEVE